MRDETFSLELGIGGGLDGLDVVSVTPSGASRYVYRGAILGDGGVDRIWRESEFQLTARELDALVAKLNEHDVLHLGHRYSDPDIADGDQWVLALRRGADEKIIYADNGFPPALVAVARYVLDSVVRPHIFDSPPRELRGSAHQVHLWEDHRRYVGDGCGVNGRGRDGDVCLRPHVGVEDLGPPAGERGATVALVLRDAVSARVVASARERRDERDYLWLPYDPKRVDPTHRHVLEVTLRWKDGASTSLPPLPVVTLGERHALELTLPSPRAAAP